MQQGLQTIEEIFNDLSSDASVQHFMAYQLLSHNCDKRKLTFLKPKTLEQI
jgi:hypothetical protein